jgi:hypothetical protein
VVFEFALHPADPAAQPALRLTITEDNTLVFKAARTATAAAQNLRRILSTAEREDFFARLRCLQVHQWPVNSDCCFGMGTTWTVAMHDGDAQRRCYGVAGLEPEQWQGLIELLETMIGRKLLEPQEP